MSSGVLEAEVGSIPIPKRRDTNAYREGTISVVLRFHAAERLLFLDEALFSLAVQSWPDIEVIIAVQNGSEQLVQDIERVAQCQPWVDGTTIQVFSVSIEGDGRSRLLNEGIRRATGRYLAFLDDDDVVYQHVYSTLIARLRASNAPLAVGGSRIAKIRRAQNHWYVVAKEAHFSWGRSQEDLFINNFIPINSYVIDRTRVKPEHLYFDESLSLLEDYDLLLRLALSYDFDFKAFGVPVCEYRVRLDGSNSISFQGNAFTTTPALHKAREILTLRKEYLLSQLPPNQCVRFHVQPSRPSAEDELGEFLFKAARKLHLFFTRHPWLEDHCARTAHSCWRQYKRLKKLVAANHKHRMVVTQQ